MGHKPDVGRQVVYYPRRRRGDRTLSLSGTSATRRRPIRRGVSIRPRDAGTGIGLPRRHDRIRQPLAACSGWTVPVDIREGRTTEVTLGGTGRLVVGKARVKGTLERPLSWSTNEPVMITAWDKTRNTQAQPSRQYVGNFLASGEFRVPDVPAGDYRLTVQVDGPPVATPAGRQAIGEGTREFTVPPASNAAAPETESETPFDVGEVTATLYHTLGPGEWAPDFVAERVDRGVVRLADFRGKLLLMIFWAAWNGPALTGNRRFRRSTIGSARTRDSPNSASLRHRRRRLAADGRKAEGHPLAPGPRRLPGGRASPAITPCGPFRPRS